MACGIFSCGMETLSGGMQDLVPWPGVEPGTLDWEHRVSVTGPPGQSQPVLWRSSGYDQQGVPASYHVFCLWTASTTIHQETQSLLSLTCTRDSPPSSVDSIAHVALGLLPPSLAQRHDRLLVGHWPLPSTLAASLTVPLWCLWLSHSKTSWFPEHIRFLPVSAFLCLELSISLTKLDYFYWFLWIQSRHPFLLLLSTFPMVPHVHAC